MTFLLTLTSLCALLLFLYKYFLHPALFSPLSKIPSAHFTAPFSPVWMLWVRSRYKENRTIHSAHQKHGPIVRLGPNEVSVNCVDGGIRTVYSGGFEKAEWYSNLFYNYDGVPTMFSMLDSKTHSIRKRMITNIYSKSFIQSSSDMREISQEILFNRFLPIIESSIVGNTTVEALDLNLASSMDFMNAYIFGLASGTDFLRDVKTRQHFLNLYQSRKAYIFWPAELPWLLSILGRFKRILTPQWIDAANDALEKWCFQMCNAARLSSEPAPVTKETPSTTPVVYNQLSQSLLSSSASALEHQTAIASEVLDQGGAGHETSGIALTYYMHELSQRPAMQSAIRSECLALSPPLNYPSSTMPSLPSPRALDALPLLHATLIETLRLHAPIPGPQPRVTPSTPTSLANSPPLPGGVRVSANAHSLHRNPDVFPNPEEWRPERWLEGSKANRDEMMRWFWAFGSGGRMCIGSNFAMQQMKLIVAAVYTNYTTHIIDDAAIEQQDAYTALPRGNLLLRFQRVADN